MAKTFVNQFSHIQARCTSENSRISISRNSDISNYVKLEASIWIKNTFWMFSPTTLWLWGLFYESKLPEMQISLYSGWLKLAQNSPINFEISRFDCSWIHTLSKQAVDAEALTTSVILNYLSMIYMICTYTYNSLTMIKAQYTTPLYTCLHVHELW